MTSRPERIREGPKGRRYRSGVGVPAAGGVVWRAGVDGRPEILLIHRPRYDDWSFPKGKRDKGETDEECALREVEEETGYRVSLGHELPTTEYPDKRGRRKRVRYWEMTTPRGVFNVNDEVDAIRWLTGREARQVLTYERDRRVLDAFLAEVARRSPPEGAALRSSSS